MKRGDTKMKSTRSVAFLLLLVITFIGTNISLAAKKRKKAPPRYAVAANSTMRLRLNDALNSKDARVGDQFQSTVVDPLYARGFEVIPAGSIVNGRVTHVTRASRKSNAGSLNVAFNGLELPNGK